MGVVRRIGKVAALFGVDSVKMRRSFRGLRPYYRNKAAIRAQIAQKGAAASEFPITKSYPCLSDRFDSSGMANGHYFHQDLHVAQLIFKNNPRRHVDVGSRVDGFVTHVASFRAIEVFDIRDLKVRVPNIMFRQRDIMQDRPDLDNCTDSISCLHTLEHFGLGRYGDPVDFDGYRKGWVNLGRMLSPGGKFYFSTPIGRQRIEFDAHRVFAIPFLLEMMKGRYRIDSFAYVDDPGDMHMNADLSSPAAKDSFGCRFGCGIFELTKL